jgi:NAD(P)H-flavin reductase
MEPSNTYALVIGPPVMYKYVLLELQIKQIPEDRIIMSLERRMKCGIGKCGHCQINGVYVCLDGPEFSYHTLKFLSEAI